MKVLILDGNPDVERIPFSFMVSGIARAAAAADHEVETVILRERVVHPCTGCFSCWLRTPGLCIYDDDHAEILRSFLNSNVVLFASPLVAGFYTSLLKTTIDRLIPLVLPYIEYAKGECRHPFRYGRPSPSFGFLYDPEEDTDQEDVGIVSGSFERSARNMNTRLLFTRPLSDDPQEVCHAFERV
ncbi:MAG: NAD(P)H-dependent oxidoreductase [Synergistota bacterium]|nr:NAD(P)H-dependent oxidoreductase [Synergistota bacterium]